MLTLLEAVWIGCGMMFFAGIGVGILASVELQLEIRLYRNALKLGRYLVKRGQRAIV